MTGTTGVEGLLTLLSHAEDPITLAAALAVRTVDAAERAAFMERATAAFGRALSVRAMQSLERYAREASRHPGAAEAAARCLAGPAPATQWLAAMLLEGLGRHGEAAGVLTSLDGTWND